MRRPQLMDASRGGSTSTWFPSLPFPEKKKNRVENLKSFSVIGRAVKIGAFEKKVYFNQRVAAVDLLELQLLIFLREERGKDLGGFSHISVTDFGCPGH